MFNKGTWDIKKLIGLGFLYCMHEDKFTKKEHFWALINPEIKPTVTKAEIKSLLEILFHFAIK
jgi:hypothetical protein